MARQRAASVGRDEAVGARTAAPIGCFAGSGGRRKLVGKAGCQRLFHAVADRQAVEDRRVVAAVLTFEKIAKRIDLGLQPCRMCGSLALCCHGGV